MDEVQSQAFVRNAARVILGRKANDTEVIRWSRTLLTAGPTEFFDQLAALAHGHEDETVFTHWKNGHYYSPVVNPDKATEVYWHKEQEIQPGEIAGIKLDLNAMIEFWQENADYLLAHPFPDHADGTTRYHHENGTFPGGDAAFVGAIMRTYSPKRIIEIGSGNSTASMLDWAERLPLPSLEITCIEPDPVRLRSILRPQDQVTIIPSLVQNVDLNVFKQLCAGDILFIDSTHVLKTGSDVHFELFYILPLLADGVIIHFHDCAYPFEYPREAVFEMNFSWNEAYAVRAFLMYNTAFRVIFWNSMFYRLCPVEMRVEFSALSRNPGGGLWVRKGAHAA